MMNPRFFVCEHCGNQIELIDDHGVPVMCCGQKMNELIPGTVDASHEKHVPQAEVAEGKIIVRVGAVEHPMVDVHYIPWVAVQTESAIYRRHLQPGQPPVAEFLLGEEKPVAVYAFCNLHGLWKQAL